MTNRVSSIALAEDTKIRAEASKLGVGLTPYVNSILAQRHTHETLSQILEQISDLDRRLARLESALIARGSESKTD